MNYWCHRHHSIWVVSLSFFIAIILQIIPCSPTPLYLFRPSWMSLVLIYWMMVLPHRVNIGTSFLLGLMMDLLTGSTLGVHSLALSILSYLVIFKVQLFRHIPSYQQGLIVILLSLITQMIICWIELCLVDISCHPCLVDISCHPKIFYKSVVDGVLWPWLSLLMCRIRCHFSVV